jgi:hypothetical protein
MSLTHATEVGDLCSSASASMSESLSFNFAINVSEWTNIVLFAIRKMFTDMLALKCRVYYALKRASNVFERACEVARITSILLN